METQTGNSVCVSAGATVAGDGGGRDGCGAAIASDAVMYVHCTRMKSSTQ